ncbi:MAG: 4-(cytidine 5'-diphospho)-2-C-methyl-D-erythritol kinase [Acidobacteriia bacterium]|nr:4-(cytidine 5'-diphospho)-2-C-methyl-D-erythritol kinase [Terriglobia bacterium]
MPSRRATIKSLAKINLDLRVLHKRTDGFHELRTVFQTISLADTIDIEYERARRTDISIDDPLAIPGNLVLKAAQAVLDELKIHARVHFRLRKKIPMGGGLGGGSSNAAAVLLALPVLAGHSYKSPLDAERIAAELGSDVPFFLTGGAAVGIGRGTEVYELADLKPEPLLVISPGLHVATGPAYQALRRGLTANDSSSRINGFRAFVRVLASEHSAGAASPFSANDFEAVVFRQFPQLQTIARKLSQLGMSGARPGVRMTGSGSAIFAIFGSRAERDGAEAVLKGNRVFGRYLVMPAALVNRGSYQRLWRRQLRQHIRTDQSLWPLHSRYEK